MGWRFARSPWFRGLHLAAIDFVVAEAVLGIVCPLHVWEDALRGETHRDGFIQRWIHAWLCVRGLELALAFSALGAAFRWWWQGERAQSRGLMGISSRRP